MTISSSLNAGVAGLSANASRLATISDNIANASTPGYKRVVSDFQSMVLQAGSGSYTAGGVRAQSTRLVGEHGTLVGTANPTDLAVRGKGFLPVTRSAAVAAGSGDLPMMLTTTGSFRTDDEGYLATQSGLNLLGVPANPDGSIPGFPRDTAAGLEPVRIDTNQFSGEPTTGISLGVNLPATSTVAGSAGSPETLSVEYFDNLATSRNLEVEFTPAVPASGASNEWNMQIRDAAAGGALIGDYTLTFNDTRTGGGTLASVTAGSIGTWSPSSGTLGVNVAGGPLTLDIGTLGGGGGLSQISDSFAPTRIEKNGFPVGSMTSVAVDETGLVQAKFDNGTTRTLYQVPLADMPNPNGLEAMDNQTFAVTRESGPMFLWDAGDGPTGEVAGFSKEESRTDVASELTNLIQTQRAYSSNAKVIQTVDEMLQETTNIKR